ncbi:S-layer homology domain-containing protein [Cohnella abietis]|uniref:SLH domain-containing protein n=1 Tax=Cohnella abietis TaxID=2507935 RepID=A0A3T1CZT9_9BACL|nr:S-layer homology domain-containing protein [Cohnella abietis]BBI31321.1 hypothetical protein KCTCHS21_07200 [Cohnella abietis]
MKNKIFKQFVSYVMIVSLLFTSVGVAYGASTAVTSDIKGHWAEAQISTWIDNGFIKGYEDGSFKPENQITRAEFFTLINRSFGFTEETAISFSDVKTGTWVYSEVAKAVKAAYITGYEDGTIGASKPITRQEAASIVDRLLGLSSTESATAVFTDSGSIASWAKASVNATVAKGILKGYTDNSFKPNKSITRAEAVATLDRAAAAKVTAYNKAGTYGPATGTETINGDVTINVAGVTLQNLVINGKLLFAAGIGKGDAFLTNVTVKGETTVNGGGANSLHFKDSKLGKIIIRALEQVRLVAEGSTVIELVEASSAAIIQEEGTTGQGFGDIILNKDLPAGSVVVLIGKFGKVSILGDKVKIELPDGTTIDIFQTDTDVTVSGKGKIIKAVLGKDSKTTFENQPTEIVGGTVVPGSGPVTNPSTPTSPVAQKGIVIGTVYTNNFYDESLASVAVSVYAGVQDSGTLVDTVVTDDDGKYSISNVPAGQFYLKFVKEGYMDRTITPANHTVTANATTDASASFMYFNLVRGYLKDTSGNPISSYLVNLYDDSGKSDYDLQTLTADDGSFEFYDVPDSDEVYIYVPSGFYQYYGDEVGPVKADGLTILEPIVLKIEETRLSNLVLSGATLSPAFSPDDWYQTASVPNNVSNTTITSTSMHPNGYVTFDADVINGIAQLNEGNNWIQIYSHSESGNYRTYQVNVYRETTEQADAIAKITLRDESTLVQELNKVTRLGTAVDEFVSQYKIAIANAAPNSLDTSGKIADLVNRINLQEDDNRLASLSLSGVTLNSPFSPDIKQYTATVSNTVTSTKVTATAINEKAEIEFDNDDATFNLKEGRTNEIRVYVYPEYQDETLYTIYVYRQPGQAQLDAIAKIRAATDTASVSRITINDLNTAAGEDIAYSDYLSDYQGELLRYKSRSTLNTADDIAKFINESIR